MAFEIDCSACPSVQRNRTTKNCKPILRDFRTPKNVVENHDSGLTGDEIAARIMKRAMRSILCAIGLCGLISPANLCAFGQQAETWPLTLDTKIEDVEDTGTFHQILSRLAARLRPGIVIGLENRSSDRLIHIKEPGPTTIRRELNALCEADRSHYFVVTPDKRIVNVLLKRPGPTTKLLHTRVNQFDLSVDDWPGNLYERVPFASGKIRALLEKRYRSFRHPLPLSSAGSILSGDVHPHFEFHLLNVSVLDILNAMAEKGVDWAEAANAQCDGKKICYSTFSPGWQVQLPDGNGVNSKY